MKRIAFMIVILVGMMAAASVRAEKIQVFVSIAPQKYFVRQIGGDLVDVNLMVPPGASPHSYEPKPRQMAALSKASAYFAIGVEFEMVWLDKLSATNPKMKIVHTEEGIEKRKMKGHHHDDGDEHHDEDHDGLSDPHIWLSPSLAKVQAKHILDGLVSVDAENEDTYKAQYNNFIARIEGLDADLKKALSESRGMKFLVFHPTWGYFADEYGLEQIAIEVEGKAPKPAQLKEIIEHAREEGIRVVFVQPQFSAKSAAVIAKAIGGEVVTADPLAENWDENLRKQAGAFKMSVK